MYLSLPHYHNTKLCFPLIVHVFILSITAIIEINELCHLDHVSYFYLIYSFYITCNHRNQQIPEPTPSQTEFYSGPCPPYVSVLPAPSETSYSSPHTTGTCVPRPPSPLKAN